VARFFLDTNVLAYADDLDAPGKQAAALALLERAFQEGLGVISVQVLQEYYVVATRKLGVDPVNARRKVELFSRLEVVCPDARDLLSGIDLQRLHGISLWDAMILQTAIQARCSVLYTEDLQHGMKVGALRIVNPFRPK
jgi:predicted nucleic acid-binding protein